MKILLVGCGLWGTNILRDLRSLGCRVDVVDVEVARRERALARGAASVLPMLPKKSDADGIIIATPASRHVESIRSAAVYDLPIFVEKPMTTSSVEAGVLARMPGPPIFVMHVWRYHPGIEALAGITRNRELGAVELLRSTRVNWTSPRTDVDPIWTLLPHDISIAIELLGRVPEPRFAELELNDGKPVGILCVLRSDSTRVVIETSTRYGSKRREVRMHCRHGIATMPNDEDGVIEVIRPSAAAVDIERIHWDGALSALKTELRVFLDYLRGGPPPKCDAPVGAQVVSTVEQLRLMAGLAPQ